MSDDIPWVVFFLSLKSVVLFRYYLIGVVPQAVKERYSSQQCPSDMISMLPDFRKLL